MARSSVVWEPLFLAEPSRFLRILDEGQLSQRLGRWPGYEDMLLGEALRATLKEDAEAADSLRGLYRFGLTNGLPVQVRRDAVAGLRLFAKDHQALPFEVWLPFLEIDPDHRVAQDVVGAWLEGNEDASVLPILDLLRRNAVASRGGVFGGLLGQGVPHLAQHLAPYRDDLGPDDVADALQCCEEALPATARNFLESWLESLEEEDSFRRDLLLRVLGQPRPEHRDQRYVAERFLPPSAEVIPIRRPTQDSASRHSTPERTGRNKRPD